MIPNVLLYVGVEFQVNQSSLKQYYTSKKLYMKIILFP
jgi:hypothetical protein